jgi:hypothetical protein
MLSSVVSTKTECSSTVGSVYKPKEPLCLLKKPEQSHMNFSYLPQDPSITENYTELQVLCQLALSPTIVSLAVENESDTSVIKKSILKEKLFSEQGINSARLECVVQS